MGLDTLSEIVVAVVLLFQGALTYHKITKTLATTRFKKCDLFRKTHNNIRKLNDELITIQSKSHVIFFRVFAIASSPTKAQWSHEV